jgi:hypothetical protein
MIDYFKYLLIVFQNSKSIRMNSFSRCFLLVSILLISAFVCCTSVYYHDLRTDEYKLPKWTVSCYLSDCRWVIPYCGNYDSLELVTQHDQQQVDFYMSFHPDSGYYYYFLGLKAQRPLKVEGNSYQLITPNVKFSTIIFRSGIYIDTVDINETYQRHWLSSSQQWNGIEPIRIPKSCKEGFLDIRVYVIEDNNTSIQDTVMFSLPIVKKRQTRTLLNPWP